MLVLFAAIVFSVGLTLKAGTWINFVAVALISGILFVAPLCIEKIRKPSWEQEIKNKLSEQKSTKQSE